MRFVTPRGTNAWMNDEKIRRWFEIVIDASSEPHQQRAYICKSCWQMFGCGERLWDIKVHIDAHERLGELPYTSSRPPQILTGEQVVRLYKLLFEYFDAVNPEVGTWKFECKACKKRFPHRSDHLELLGHYRTCETVIRNMPIQ